MKYYIGNIPYGNDLTHFGIKGQRWGVRRFQNEDRTWTAAGKIRYGDDATGKAVNGLKKGSTVYRSSVNKDETTSSGKVMYVSGSQVDRNHYRGGVGAQWLKDTSGNSKANIYEYKYKLKEDLKTANREDVRKIYEQLKKQDKRIEKDSKDTFIKSNKELQYIKSDRDRELSNYKNYAKEYISKYGKTKYTEAYSLTKQRYDKYIKETEKRLANEYSKLSAEDVFDYAGARSIGGHEYTKNRIISELKKQGYNSMIDQASVGTRNVREGVAPLIIFNPEKTMEKTSLHAVSDRQQKRYGKKYNKWQRAQQSKLNKFNKG